MFNIFKTRKAQKRVYTPLEFLSLKELDRRMEIARLEWQLAEYVYNEVKEEKERRIYIEIRESEEQPKVPFIDFDKR